MNSEPRELAWSAPHTSDVRVSVDRVGAGSDDRVTAAADQLGVLPLEPFRVHNVVSVHAKEIWRPGQTYEFVQPGVQALGQAITVHADPWILDAPRQR
jgi:hypothetical protein